MSSTSDSPLDAHSKPTTSNFTRLDTQSESTLIPEKLRSSSSSKSRIPKLLRQPRRAYKTWIRCTITFGVTMVLLVATETSEYMGQAAFFAAIMAVMLPPSFALSIFIMANTTLLVGMLIGWAWACAAMAAALSIRSPTLLAEQTLKVQSMIDPTSPMSIPNQMQYHMFHGLFLDPWSSAVYGIFLFVGAFAMGALRAYVPRMALLSIFATIVIDVVATMGPLFPTAQYTIVKMFFIPTGFYVVVAIAALILVFPESLSHIWLTSLENDFISPVQELLALLTQSLNAKPSNHEAWQKLTDEGNEIRDKMIDGTEALLSQIALIDLDVSVGRLGPADLKKISGELKGFLFRAASLHSFHAFVNDKNKTDQEAESQSYYNPHIPSSSHSSSNPTAAAQPPSSPTTSDIPLQDLASPFLHPTYNNSNSNYNIVSLNSPTTSTTNLNASFNRNNASVSSFHHLRSKITQVELEHGHDFDSLVPILSESSLALREACEQGVRCLKEWVGRCNSNRVASYFKKNLYALDGKRQGMEEVVWSLESKLNEFRDKERSKMITPYEKFFDPVTRKFRVGEEGGEVFISRSLYLSFVFIDTLDAFSESLLKTLRVLLIIDGQRPCARIWFPGRSLFTPSKIKDNITGQDRTAEDGLGDAMVNVDLSMGLDNPVSMGTSKDLTTFAVAGKDRDGEGGVGGEGEGRVGGMAMGDYLAEDDNPVKRDPDAFPPSSVSGKMWLKICGFFRFLKSPEGMFALRTGLLSVALWLPSVFKSTAWFYYEQKGMWGLIMAQMALAVYAGDQIAGFVLRMIGTAIGLVIGVALWYMGAGTGNGNPYAVVVVTTLLLSPFIYLRLCGPKHLEIVWIMVAVTGVFVVGYSWINANTPVLANPGVGISLGWKRALLVMVGFTSAFVVMVFPTPLSSRVLVRKTAAGVITELGRVFGGEIEAFLAEESRARSGIHERVVFKQDEAEEDKISTKERRVRRIAKRVVAIATRLREIEPSLDEAKYEPQLSGSWPQKEYRTFLELERRTLAALVLLISSFEKLDTKHCAMLVQQTPYLNPNFIADIFSTLAMLSSSLTSGTPLPPYLPQLRERLIYHAYARSHATMNLNATTQNSKAEASSQNALPDSSRVDTKGASGVTEGLDDITLDMLLDEQLPAYSTAVVALSSIVFRIDTMADIVKTLCGQATIPGHQMRQMGYDYDHLDWQEKGQDGHLNTRR